MIKNILSVFAVASVLVLSSCSSEPSDLRPETKVSVDSVPPGHRNNTSNIDAGSYQEGHDDVYINHDEHANEIKKEVEGVPASQKATNAENVTNHE
ncbi:hypothetical protein [Rufibacter ruber]|uniref:hypothetical protein n=1 Tax=Rufibacter ruber TaxID=1783499 RepID=UPI00082AE021|nr:hypothetical protein [Rufibacter ruber]